MASLSLDQPAPMHGDAAPETSRGVLDLDSRALILCHLWVAFVAFAVAALLGA